MLRVSMATALALSALTTIAAAQSKMLSYEPPKEEKPLFDERQYKAAIGRIPEAKHSNDPWAGAREVTPPQAAASAPAQGAKRK